MNFCAIMPTVLLPIIGAHRMHHFALAHCCKDPEYLSWYAESDCNVILDNGAYEHQRLSFDPLYGYASAMGCNVLICPDMINDPVGTEYLGQCFREYLSAALAAHRSRHFSPTLGYVLQVRPGDTITSITGRYRNILERGFRWIGFSRCIDDAGQWERTKIMLHLRKECVWDDRVKHHALGFTKKGLNELAVLRDHGISSVDSSNPVWRLIDNKNHFNARWSGTLTEELQERIQAKLYEVDNLCR